jgi:hypothetical protein
LNGIGVQLKLFKQPILCVDGKRILDEEIKPWMNGGFPKPMRTQVYSIWKAF